MWSELLAAIGLMLVLEGIMPFLNPDKVKRALLELTQLENRILRSMGLISMLIGLVMLYLTR
jgi:hypothetical protein